MGTFFLVWKCRAICPFSYCLILCSIFCKINKERKKANHHTPFCRVEATIHMHFSPLINAKQTFSGWFEVLFQRKNKEFWLRLLAGIEFYRIKLLIFMASIIKSKIPEKKCIVFISLPCDFSNLRVSQSISHSAMMVPLLLVVSTRAGLSQSCTKLWIFALLA